MTQAEALELQDEIVRPLQFRTEDSYDRTLAVVGKMAESIAESFEMYRECFEKPADFTGDVESI